MMAEYQGGDTADQATRNEKHYLCKYRESYSLGSKPQYGRQRGSSGMCYGRGDHSTSFRCLCHAPPPNPDEPKENPCRRLSNPCPDYKVCGSQGRMQRYTDGQCEHIKGEKVCIYSIVNLREPCVKENWKVHKVKDLANRLKDLDASAKSSRSKSVAAERSSKDQAIVVLVNRGAKEIVRIK